MKYFALRVSDTDNLVKDKHIPLFYRDCIHYFQELNRKSKVLDTDKPEIIWCNHNVKFNGKPVMFKHWAKSGIKMTQHVIENSVYKEHDIFNKLLRKAGFMFEMSIIKHSIPDIWKTKVFDIVDENEQNIDIIQNILDTKYKLPCGKEKSLSNLTSKDIYQILLFSNKTIIRSKGYWSRQFPDRELIWNDWFHYNFVNKSLPRKCKDFNWRIFHGLVNTESRLKAMKYSDGICKVCKGDFENLKHLLSECTKLGNLWKEIEIIIKIIEPEFSLNDFHKIAGYFKRDLSSDIINVILTICRWCIWKSRNLCKYENENSDEIKLTHWVKHEIKQHLILLQRKDDRVLVIVENL